MPNREQILEWLGEGWRVSVRRVSAANWRKPAWRAQFLCQRARLDCCHVLDFPDPEDARKRIVLFGVYVG